MQILHSFEVLRNFTKTHPVIRAHPVCSAFKPRLRISVLFSFDLLFVNDKKNFDHIIKNTRLQIKLIGCLNEFISYIIKFGKVFNKKFDLSRYIFAFVLPSSFQFKHHFFKWFQSFDPYFTNETVDG